MTDIENTELMLDEGIDEDEVLEGADQTEDSADSGTNEEKKDEAQDVTDYAALAVRDLAELAEIFPEVRSKRSITELSNPLRYAALRDLGLTPKEAYLATGGRQRERDNRAHLTVSAPCSATKRNLGIPRSELKIAREIFSDMNEAELQKLYKKVSG